jgi:Domain of unknown function (DUF4129)
MQASSPAPRRSLRLVVVGSALLALLALVAFASRSGFGSHSSNATPSSGFTDWAFSSFVVLFVAAIPLTIYGYLSSAGDFVRRKRPSYRRRMLRSLGGLAFVLLAVVLFTYVRRHHTGGFHLDLRAFQGAAHGHHGAAPAHRSPAFQWPVALIGGAVWVAIIVGWYTARRRLRRYRPAPAGIADATLAADVAGTIGEAIGDLEAEPDARRAVIAAYARMEGVLARHGLRREPAETPLEYLRRVLLGLTARGDAVQSLTRLFEEARFSRHEIDATMKQDAIGALRTIRDDLAGAEA